MQTTLQAELGEEADIGRLYVAYRDFAVGRPKQVAAADQLRILGSYSTHYCQLVTGDGNTPIAQFGRRIAPWDASTVHAIALLIAKSECDANDQRMMFDAIVSYFVRRAVCGLTPKNYNKVLLHLFKQLTAGKLTPVALQSALAELDGDSSRWPRDEEFRKSWLEADAYPGRLRAPQVKSMLVELEQAMRSVKTEEPFVLGVDALDVDHVLPTSWFEYWPLPDGTTAEASEVRPAKMASFSDQPIPKRLSAIHDRERHKTRMGNLTLLDFGVNRSLQHHAFEKKRKELFAHSNLHLNRELMLMEKWDEETIDQRGEASFERARRIWSGPTG